MSELCCICLESMNEKSYFQKCLNNRKKCPCDYYIHNACLLKYIDHRLKSKQDIKCVVCKSEIISYNYCISLKDDAIYNFNNFISNIFFFMKLLFYTMIISTFLNLCREILYTPFF